MQRIKDFLSKGGLDFFEEQEKLFECAGVCETGLFYATIDISEGKPEVDCINALIDDL